METLHIYVGTDQWQQAAGAERVLEHSIRKHATCPVAIHWMRAGDPGFEVAPDGSKPGHWNIGRPIDQAWPKKGWGTPFSGFRFAVPELCGFTGRAVYMDADMLVLGDVAELLFVETPHPWVCCRAGLTDVSVIDCGWFANKKWWPAVASMKASRWQVFHYCQMLARQGAFSETLSYDWNCRDNSDQWKPSTKLLHFTHVPWQPYRPYPTVRYENHPKQAWVDKWFEEKEEADAAVG